MAHDAQVLEDLPAEGAVAVIVDGCGGVEGDLRPRRGLLHGVDQACQELPGDAVGQVVIGFTRQPPVLSILRQGDGADPLGVGGEILAVNEDVVRLRGLQHRGQIRQITLEKDAVVGQVNVSHIGVSVVLQGVAPFPLLFLQLLRRQVEFGEIEVVHVLHPPLEQGEDALAVETVVEGEVRGAVEHAFPLGAGALLGKIVQVGPDGGVAPVAAHHGHGVEPQPAVGGQEAQAGVGGRAGEEVGVGPGDAGAQPPGQRHVGELFAANSHRLPVVLPRLVLRPVVASQVHEQVISADDGLGGEQEVQGQLAVVGRPVFVRLVFEQPVASVALGQAAVGHLVGDIGHGVAVIRGGARRPVVEELHALGQLHLHGDGFGSPQGQEEAAAAEEGDGVLEQREADVAGDGRQLVLRPDEAGDDLFGGAILGRDDQGQGHEAAVHEGSGLGSEAVSQSGESGADRQNGLVEAVPGEDAHVFDAGLG